METVCTYTCIHACVSGQHTSDFAFPGSFVQISSTTDFTSAYTKETSILRTCRHHSIGHTCRTMMGQKGFIACYCIYLYMYM